MKNLMLLAYGICIALLPAKLHAQNTGDAIYVNGLPRENVFEDTLLISTGSKDKLLLIGPSLQEMTRYNRADSIKTLFLSDWQRSLEQKSVSPDAVLVYYFVHPSGKRRLKAESAEYTESRIDAGYEQRRLNLDLPAHRIIIYDMDKEFRMEFFCNDLSNLNETLGNTSMDAALSQMASNRSLMRQNYRVGMEQAGTSYHTGLKAGHKLDILEALPAFGVTLVGNRLAPMVELCFLITLNNKYGVGSYRFGLSSEGMAFVNLDAGGELKGIDNLTTYNGVFMVNLADRQVKDNLWLGVRAGYVRSGVPAYNGCIKVGLMLDRSGTFNYSFDALINSHGQSIPQFTVRMPF